MANEITITEFSDRLQELGNEEFQRRLSVVLTETALKMDDRAKRNANERPKARSGRLRASVRSYVVNEGQMPKIVLQAGGQGSQGRVVYAGAQEFGATIRPRAADFLRIPLAPAKTPAGVDRYSGSLRVLAPDEFFAFRSGEGKLFLAKHGDEVAPGVPRAWYRLVKQSEIPATFFLRRAMNSVAGKMRPDLADLFRVALQSDRM